MLKNFPVVTITLRFSQSGIIKLIVDFPLQPKVGICPYDIFEFQSHIIGNGNIPVDQIAHVLCRDAKSCRKAVVVYCLIAGRDKQRVIIIEPPSYHS
jgi:hypothetical protein